MDFRDLVSVNIYRDENAFTPQEYTWAPPERFLSRSTKGLPRLSVRDASRLHLVLGSKCRSGEFLDNWNAVYGPVGPDGYPKPLWDYRTGRIDRKVAQY